MEAESRILRRNAEKIATNLLFAKSSFNYSMSLNIHFGKNRKRQMEIFHLGFSPSQTDGNCLSLGYLRKILGLFVVPAAGDDDKA